MKILAVDYGLKRIGLAFSEGELAQPLGKLVVKNRADAMEKVLRTAATYETEVIVVGLPDPDTIKAGEFGDKLKQLSSLPVSFVDETLTSQEALSKLKTHPLRKRKQLVDSAAASLILASYLEEQRLKQ